MAKLFLSYSRKDQAKARRLTEWLEREGHAVWRDEDDIGGGASFSSEIEKALQDADAVLVLWSADSVQSAWVRDEAGYGRDAGKFIPLSLDGTDPPLGFRQFQSVNVSRWSGHKEPADAERIRRAIANIAHLPQAPITNRSTQVRRSFWGASRVRLIAAAGTIAAALLVSIFVWERWSDDRQIVIAVLASPQSSNRGMAADYASVVAADMAASLPRRFDRATVIGPADDNARRSGYRMVISTNPEGPGVNASLTLSDEDGRTTLWSKAWSVTSAPVSLKQDISAAASKAALCLTDARGGTNRLTQPALGVYLSGCVGLGDSQLSDVDFQTIFERVTKLAPNFAPGWGYLALSEANFASDQRRGSPAYAAAVERARQSIAIARKLNPNSALTYHAEYHLIDRDRFRALQVIEKAAKIDPDDGLVQMHVSDELMAVGNLSDAVQAAQRAIELEPNSSYARSQYILTLVYAGEFSKAKADIAEARQKWPNDTQIDFAEFAYQYRYGDPRRALELLPRITDFSDANMTPSRKVITARLDPTAAAMDAAIAALSAAASNDPRGQNLELMALANFGRTDAAYQLMEDSRFQPFIDTNALFRPDFAAIRADPRFMQIAARLGLVRYWRETGNWPDFCASEQLRYDCKAEASKYRT